ncbi:hypothetical protein [Hydrogenophaga sp.]|uniref:hypothetical protein n=1 Tax=Hydrogenophaga sp. TaxID=1904254 RepID=UPI0027318E19|nr:hypothetical protein [Hydrogenophaga sp.]MDP2015777.1 hypothetical protein [Hydrogenophaga sp.]MDP3167455.1 hypothetical protein [Hydrogenophaga sp.]MDP3809567.1 hypothetical protein [Hydrogenophaga sp.]
MASDLDTVRVLRALFNDMPRAPQGLSGLELMAWIKSSMTDFEGGEMAYMIEHITRNSMLDIVLHMRESGHLQDDAAFDETVALISTEEGRRTFRDRCINAQKTVDVTERLLKRARRSTQAEQTLFVADPQEIERFVSGQASGPGPLFAEYAAREDVREIGVFDQTPTQVHEFAWGFVVEHPGAWNVYVAEVWRQGTVGYFDRFLNAWKLEAARPLDDAGSAPAVPAGLLVDDGIGSFSSLCFELEAGASVPQVRRWLGETFIGRMLPRMAAKVLDDTYDFPANGQAS